MAITFLDITNETLRRLNEVELTASTFPTATGYHAVVKDGINGAVRDIIQSETEWPFTHVTATQVLTPHVQRYALPAEARTVDWQTFYLKRDDAIMAMPRALPYVDYDHWNDSLRWDDEYNDAGEPIRYIVRTQHNEFLVSPPPDQPYTVQFEYWRNSPTLVNASDVVIIPEDYRHVVVDGAMLHAYLFRGNTEAAAIVQKKYEAALKNMRSLLINRYNYVRDTRVAGYLRSGLDF